MDEMPTAVCPMHDDAEAPHNQNKNLEISGLISPSAEIPTDPDVFVISLN